MLVAIPDVLTAEEVAQCRRVLEGTAWVDGRVTAGEQSAKAKYNLQVPETAPEARQLGDLILRALGRNPTFNSAALPHRVFPPLFNRYDAGMKFDAHVDNAVRYVASAGIRIRTDVSSTLFLSAPEDYDDGELVVEDTFGTHAVKLAAGSMILYPATSLHRVNPITRGSRWASFFWTQSMVQDDGERRRLVSTSQLSVELTRLVRATRADLKPALDHLDSVVDVLRKNQQNLDNSLRLMAPFYRVFANTLGTGPWFDTIIQNFPPVPDLAAQSGLGRAGTDLPGGE